MLRFETELAALQVENSYRSFPDIEHHRQYVTIDGQKLLNLSGNDYLGIGADNLLQSEFLENLQHHPMKLGSTSSRLLTGNDPIYHTLENNLATRYQRPAALIFNSGYHANCGILPALSDSKTLILADKLVHASIIDGIRLSKAKFERYHHNDMQHLRKLLEKHATNYETVFIVTESIFSMDGDSVKITELLSLKQEFNNVMLYVDEAHSVGVRGKRGLGLCEEYDCIDGIDLLVGTFGKAFASMGAYLICTETIRNYLINKMRPLIFSTALPPITIAWSNFVLEKLDLLNDRRKHLATLSKKIHAAIVSPSESHIIPVIFGENHATLSATDKLRQSGFYTLPIRPPTVPQGTSRIRLSLSAAMSNKDAEALITQLKKVRCNLLNI